MFCPHCGKEIKEKAVICIHCGCEVNSTPKIKNNNGCAIGCIVLILIFFIFVILGITVGNDNINKATGQNSSALYKMINGV